MKNIIVLSLFLAGSVYLASAQTATPVSNLKQKSQSARIAHGRVNGELTKAEFKALKREQRHIRRVKRRAKSDGVVTAEERTRINRKQRRANRHIRRQKHDDQKRF